MYKNASKYYGRNRGLTKHVTFNSNKSNKINCPCCNKEILRNDLRTHLRENHLKEEFIRCEFCNDVVWEKMYSKHLSVGHHDYDYNMLQSEKNNHSAKPYNINEKRFNSNLRENTNNSDTKFQVKLLMKKAPSNEKLVVKKDQTNHNKKSFVNEEYICTFCNLVTRQGNNHEKYCKPRLMKKR